MQDLDLRFWGSYYGTNVSALSPKDTKSIPYLDKLFKITMHL